MTAHALDGAYCVMGNPIAHSLSPRIHMRCAQLIGIPLHYSARLVPLDGFAAALRDFARQGGRGCNVTVPFKLEAAQYANTCSKRVQWAGAANTLTWKQDGSIHADNTDGVGLVRDIERNAGFALAGRDLLLMGAGGAAAGVLEPLMAAGVAHITVINRTQAKAEALANSHAQLALQHGTELRTASPAALEQDFDLVINATASSLAGAAVPVAAHVLRPGALAYDMMYGPPAQGFMAWASLHGASARDGLGMLVEQAAEAFYLWHGVRPPSAQVLAELKILLA